MGQPVAEVRRPWLAVWLLTAGCTLCVLDRSILGVLAESISFDLNLSDSQLGLLGGFGFSLAFGIFGIPWGWIADKDNVNRAKLVSVAMAIWSVATGLCAGAQNFTQLLLGRMGVAAGEAGYSAPSHALIADLVPGNRLASALAIFGLGLPLGSFLGRAAGGALNDVVGWRGALIAAALLGALVAPVLLLLIKDPRRQKNRERQPSTETERAGILRQYGVTVREMSTSPAYTYMALGSTSIFFLAGGTSFWGLIHFQRNLNLSASEVGLWLGAMSGVSGIIGGMLGGAASDFLGSRSLRHYLTPAAVGALLAPPLLLLAWNTDVVWLAVLLLLIPSTFDNIGYGGIAAMAQRLVSPNVRSSANSLLLMMQGLLGSGLGITSMGFASDLLRTHFGYASSNESIRITLMAASVLYVVPACLLWKAGKHLAADVARSEPQGSTSLARELADRSLPSIVSQ